jgi:hypothetical protein
VRHGLRQLLEREANMEVVGDALAVRSRTKIVAAALRAGLI